MKKYLSLSLITLFLIAIAVFIPKMLDNSMTEVEVLRPKSLVVSEDIYANGIVEELSKKDIFVELPIVPESVNFQIGDTVKPNDIIATVDTAATQSALLKLVDSSKLIPAEYLEVLGNISIDENIIKGYIPTEIVSPTSGVVTEMNLLAGSISTPKSLACTISRTDIMRVRMSINEISADKVQVGDTVVFKASATEDVKYTGKIAMVFPAASKTISGTSQVTAVSIYVSPDDDYSRLKPGYTVTGVVKKQGKEAAITIPYESVMQDEDNKEYVYIFENSRAVRKDIVTGAEFYDRVEVKSGVDENDLIIANAASIKGDNSLVRLG